MSLAELEATPCEVEAEQWRCCLKKFDYMPEKGREFECDTLRLSYFRCLDTWRKKGPTALLSTSNIDLEKMVTEREKDYQSSYPTKLPQSQLTPSAPYSTALLPQECGVEGAKLQACMGNNAFDILCCQSEMLNMRKCFARTNKEARALLEEDVRNGRIKGVETVEELWCTAATSEKGGGFWDFLRSKNKTA